MNAFRIHGFPFCVIILLVLYTACSEGISPLSSDLNQFSKLPPSHLENDELAGLNPFDEIIPPGREVTFTHPVLGVEVTAAEGELLVKLKDGEPLTEMKNLRKKMDYTILGRLAMSGAVYRIKFDPDVNIAEAWAELLNDPRIEVVEPNYFAYPALVPNDPFYSEKFELPKINAPQAWDMTSGSIDVWVAVIDTGADRNHPDLANNIVPGKDFITGGDGLGGETPGDGIDNNNDGAVDQNVGHGTHVSGIICEEAFNNVGACGVAYNVKVIPLRIFPTNGDTGATFSSIIDAIGYANQQPKVRVINMSIGTTYQSTLLQNAINEAWSKGKVIVAAACNSNTSDKYYPAAHDNVVAVAALNKSGQKASFSNYGSWVDISAYGTGIYSTCFNDTYKYMSGTSMACPLVSGCFALLFSYSKILSNEQAVQILLGNTDDVNTINPDYAGLLGSGIVNPHLALVALYHSQPGEITDGRGRGRKSIFTLELGPHAQG